MEQTSPINTNRRTFLKTGLRYAVTGVTGLGGIALFRRNSGNLTTTCCDPKGITGCSLCGKLALCGLPRGLSFKEVHKENIHVR